VRTYELALVLDPRLSDEEVASLVDEYRGMITAQEGTLITKQESWGKRKLAYPIEKLTEGRYVFLYVAVLGEIPPFPELELRMNQNEQVLRYLLVRTDQDIERAKRKGKRPVPAAEPFTPEMIERAKSGVQEDFPMETEEEEATDG